MICSLPEGFPLKRRTNPVHHGLAAFTAGLDLVAQLNLFGPRDFLLQLEEEHPEVQGWEVRMERLGFQQWTIPSGKHTKTMENPLFFMGKSTISMGIFNSFLYVYQRIVWEMSQLSETEEFDLWNNMK